MPPWRTYAREVRRHSAAPHAPAASFRNLRQSNRVRHAMFAQVDKPLEQAVDGATSRTDWYIDNPSVIFEPQKQPAALERLAAATANKPVVIRVIPEFHPDFHRGLQFAAKPAPAVCANGAFVVAITGCDDIFSKSRVLKAWSESRIFFIPRGFFQQPQKRPV